MKYYEVVLFTASLPSYANSIMRVLDPKGEMPRMYRQNCNLIRPSYYIKDLRRVGRPMNKLFIVDNSPLAYLLHPDNAMPIENYYDSKTDKHLFKYTEILKFMALSKIPPEEFLSKIVVREGTMKLDYDKYQKFRKHIEMSKLSKRQRALNDAYVIDIPSNKGHRRRASDGMAEVGAHSILEDAGLMPRKS